MKVKLAAQVLSNTCSAALDFGVAKKYLQSNCSATSSYCKHFNDIFDILNSTSPKDRVQLRRPFSRDSPIFEALKNEKTWLENLRLLNIDRRNSFIKGV